MKTLFRIFNVMFFSAALVFAVVSMTFAAGLPDGLTELQYIEVGKVPGFIDTGVTINKSKMPGKYRQVLKASWVGAAEKQYCGAGDAFSLGCDGGNIIVSNGIRGPGIQFDTPYTIDATYDVNKEQVSFSVDGGTGYTGSLLSFTDGAPFTVFADSGNNSVFLPGSRVYSYQLYIDDDLVVDLVPVQSTGGDVVGMYDTVSRGLFERIGDGDFVPGPEVVDTSISQICTDMIVKEGLETYYYDEVNSARGKYTVAAVMQTVPNASSLLESVPETCTLKCQDPTLTLDFGALNSCMQGDASACSDICADFVSTNGPCRNNGEKYNYKGKCVMTTYQDSGIDLVSWADFVDKAFGIPAGYVDASDYPHACPKLDKVMSDAGSGRCVCKDGGWFDTTTGTCLDSFVIDFDDKTSMTVSLKNAPTTVASSSVGLFDTFGHVVFDSNGEYAYGVPGRLESYISTDVGNPGHVFASAGKSASSVTVVKIELLDTSGNVSQNIYYVPSGSNGNYYFTDEKLGKPLTGAVITGIPTITGYTFGGYFSQKNAGGTKYVDAKGAFASNWWDGSSLTVQMQPFYTANTITLDLRPEGSTVKTTTCSYGSTFVLPTPTERSGYTFNGWIMPDGKTYAAGTSVTCNNALLGTDDGTTKSIGASWTPKSAPAGSCPGSFFDYENKEWIQDYTCEDVGQNLIGEGFDHNVLTDGCSCMCDPFDAAFNPVAANACMKGETDACAEVCIPLDQPCDYGQRPYVVDGIAQCGYYFDPEFGLIDYYGSQRWGEFLDGNGMSAGYMSPTGELLPCYGDGVKESEDGTGRCVCADGGWFLMDGGRCVQELPVGLMLDTEGTQVYNNLMLDFWHNPFNLADEGYGLPDGGTGLTLDQIMDMVNGQGTQMFDNNGEWTYTPMGTGTQYIYKSIPLVGYPVYSGTPAPVVVKVDLDFQDGNSSWSEFYYVYGRTTPGPFFNSSSVQTPINNSVIDKPTRTGYAFGGYYTSTNVNGQQYVDENGVINDNLVYYTSTTPLTLYAHWTANTYTVSFNANDGTGGQTANVTATYAHAMPAISTTAPTRPGYTFSGWYDNATSGTKYYNADGTSAQSWDKTANTTLYAHWNLIEPEFSLTTTSLAAGTEFSFTMSAQGDFVVDWGDGNVETITRTNTTNTTYSHTYTTAGTYTIGMSGQATGYNSDTTIAAISFNGNTNIAGISGSLGAIFGTLSSGTNRQPRFHSTFYNCSNLTGSIPSGLFSGISGAPAAYMFASTFSGCSGLTGSIPENLFAGISGTPADSMFSYTFSGCSGLTGSIPENLFAGITGAPASSMFQWTFTGCGGLTGSIPAGLFAGISGAPASSMFYQTFNGCSGLTGSIPENLFKGISGAPANYMFASTFKGCSGLTGSIPENLFAGISGAPADYMFREIFYNCSGLTGSIPENLFKGISGAPANSMFYSTFSGCSGLTGSIPENLFAGISGAPASGMFQWTFTGCGGLTGSIPENLFAGISGAPASWMFSYTFNGCSNLTGSIPENLFAGITGAPASYMFRETFSSCSNLTGSIPENLFAGITGAPADNMFYRTFFGCSNLTGSIPENLFAGISGAPASHMFRETFSSCSNLTGSIPAGLFAGISGAPASSMFYLTFNGCSGLTGFVPKNLFAGITNTNYASGPMSQVFNGSGLVTSCPVGYYKYITGFEVDFNSKVACTPCPTGYTSDAGATANTGCYLTVDGGQVRDGTSGTTLSTCAAGTYKTSHNEYYGTSYSCDACPTTNPYSPAGAADAGACGRKLHIGDNVMYLRSTQKTTPSLKFDFNKDGVADLFGNMSTSSKMMSSGADKSFKVNYGGQVYYIHDDSAQ